MFGTPREQKVATKHSVLHCISNIYLKVTTQGLCLMWDEIPQPQETQKKFQIFVQEVSNCQSRNKLPSRHSHQVEQTRQNRHSATCKSCRGILKASTPPTPFPLILILTPVQTRRHMAKSHSNNLELVEAMLVNRGLGPD